MAIWLRALLLIISFNFKGNLIKKPLEREQFDLKRLALRILVILLMVSTIRYIKRLLGIKHRLISI
jgi:hypothetical protein